MAQIDTKLRVAQIANLRVDIDKIRRALPDSETDIGRNALEVTIQVMENRLKVARKQLLEIEDARVFVWPKQ
jgi:hypothetical protein